MKNIKLEVGEISSQIFLSLVVRAINESERHFGDNEETS